MVFRTALKNQTHAALCMLSECIEACPSELWISGEHPRLYWKIAYHATMYADCFLSPSFEAWERWPHHRREAGWTMSDDGTEIPVIEPYTPEQVSSYLNLIRSRVDERVDALDLDDETCGIPWYPELSRAELLILNLRHISEHVGQLHELRLAVGLDVDWRASRDY